MTDHH